ncbi:MAG: TlyA family RNA methyltransferase [Spirochaetota bacterium]
MKKRLDALILQKGMAESRQKARAYIMAGNVTVNGTTMIKPSAMVSEEADIQMKQADRYVSRGGLKLEKALDRFEINSTGALCLDIGASTGGFTHCLLQRGALKVVAVDVGKGQIDYTLRKDPRVHVVENFNARFIDQLEMEACPRIVTVDVSFISIRLILNPLFRVVDFRSQIVALIKPQFELEKPYPGFNGVIKQKPVHLGILKKLNKFFFEEGYTVRGFTFSPLKGPKGNREYFVYLHKSQQQGSKLREGWDAVAEKAVEESYSRLT